MNKIFGVGLSKTGTNSLCEALGHLGFPMIHYPGPKILLPGHLDNMAGAVDLPVVRYYKNLDRLYPGSKFILTMRPLDDWLVSVQSHFERRAPDRRSAWGKECGEAVYGTLKFDRERFAQIYLKHCDDVIAYFADRPDFTVINIFTSPNPWADLIAGLGLDAPVPEIKFPQRNRDPAKQEKLDLVYPYRAGSSGGEELRYSLRSMECNFLNLRDVWIIGDKPQWASDQIRHIPFEHVKRLRSNEYAKNRNITEKMLKAAMTPDISEEFVYAADDHYLIRPWSRDDFEDKALVLEDLNNFPKEFLNPRTRPIAGLSEWQRALWITYDRVRAEGYYGWNYETHTPKLIDKGKLLQTLAMHGIAHGTLLWQTAYFNTHWQVHRALDARRSQIKAGFYESCDDAEVDRRLEHATFVNHNDKGMTPYLRTAIASRFPGKSKFER